MFAVLGFAAGLLLLAVGAGLIYLPAGLIVAGLLLVGVAVAYERGRIRAARRG